MQQLFFYSVATSDNLEAISEAASSHSVTSDLDNENDNLSDMMSANVSGRGTPNVSGRDTPISQADSQMEGPEERQPMVPDLPVIVQKTNREDVTDRFGKFEIKHEIESEFCITWLLDNVSVVLTDAVKLRHRVGLVLGWATIHGIPVHPYTHCLGLLCLRL